MPRKIIFVIVLSIILSSCAPARTPEVTQTSQVCETCEVSPATSTPEATATSTPSATPTVKNVGDGATLLSIEQAAQWGLVGEGILIQAEYHGIPIDCVSLISVEAAKQIGVTHFALNPKHAQFGDPANVRLAHLILMGHYRGFLEDRDLTYETYTFEQYMLDLKAGKDMRYFIWDGDVEGVVGGARVKIDPRARTEVVLAGGILDPNGPSNTYITDAFRYGYGVNDDGGVRIALVLPLHEYKGDKSVLTPFMYGNSLRKALWALGWSENEQQYGPRVVGKTSIPESEYWLDTMRLVEIAETGDDGYAKGVDDALFIFPK